jgi:hypothetical protein
MINNTKDEDVINDCLILKKHEYPNIRFNQQNFKFLFAENLEITNSSMFKESKLEYIYCPTVRRISGNTN